MKRSTITLPDPLAKALDAYLHDQEIRPSLTVVVQAALEQFLAERGYLLAARKRLRITPATRGSGSTDTSVAHDTVLVEHKAGHSS